MKWEYQCSPIPPIERAFEDAQSALNEFGHDGWELVSIIPEAGKDGSWNIAILKRPVPN